MKHTLVAVIAIAVTALLGLTACSAGPQPTTTEATDTSVPTPSAPATPSEKLTPAQNQVKKFKYMQDPERLVLFANSGYDVAKVKLAKDIMGGKFGTPTTSVEDTIFAAEVGDPLDPSKFYAWFFADDNGKGAPDFSTVWNVGVQAPGYGYVQITDTVHDWPTEIGGKSVDLKYGVAVGPSYLEHQWATCLWPDLKDEKDVCYGENSDEETKTVNDLMSAEQQALRVLNDNMTHLYGEHWREG